MYQVYLKYAKRPRTFWGAYYNEEEDVDEGEVTFGELEVD